jgi:hypothetical protein
MADVGQVEQGVRTTLTEWGILEPTGAWEVMAINLAQVLDGTNATFKMSGDAKYGKDDKVAVASVNRELRLTLEKIEAMPRAKTDDKETLENKY